MVDGHVRGRVVRLGGLWLVLTLALTTCAVGPAGVAPDVAQRARIADGPASPQPPSTSNEDREDLVPPGRAVVRDVRDAPPQDSPLVPSDAPEPQVGAAQDVGVKEAPAEDAPVEEASSDAPAPPTPEPVDAAAPAPAPPPQPPEPPVQADAEPARVVIPRIGVSNPMTPVGLHPDRSLVVPDDAQVVGWYTGAPRPGQVGPAIVAGHNTWKGATGVFWRLHELAPGDLIEVHQDTGDVVRFIVDRLEQHPKDAFPSQRVYGNTTGPELRIITCGGPFDQQRRSHVDNVIVFATRTG